MGPLILSIVILFVLLGGGMWIAAALGIAAFVSLYIALGDGAWRLIGMTAWDTSRSFIFVAVPLFVFMAEIINNAGIAEHLYTGIGRLLNGLRGGLFQATVVACTVIAALLGASIVSAAMMGRLAYPELKKRGYDQKLALGTICAGGTLAILIPPSITMIIYGGMTGESVAQLFTAGIIPGIFVSLAFMTYIGIRTLLNRNLAPVPESGVNMRARLNGLLETVPMIILIVFILASIYTGIATPTEAGAVAVVGATVLAAIYRRLSWKVLWTGAMSAVKITSFVFFIVTSAQIMGMVLGHYHVPGMLAEWARSIESPPLVLTLIIVFYLIMGYFFDATSLVVLTVGFITPMITAAGFDLVFFGIILVLLCEICLLTPPIGMNLFVLQGATKEPLQKVVSGSLPYVVILTGCLIVLVLFPQIILWLPSQVYN